MHSLIQRTFALGLPVALGAAWACTSPQGPGGGGGGQQTGGQLTGGAVGNGVGGTASGGGSPDGSGGRPTEGRCTDPVPLDPNFDTGTFKCDEGYLHRERAEACPYVLPRSEPTEWPSALQGGAGGESSVAGWEIVEDLCSGDADCGAHQACVVSTTCQVGPDTPISDLGFPCAATWLHFSSRQCSDVCQVDADCGAGAACICGEEYGTCVPLDADNGCHSDQDCDTGFFCIRTTANPRGDSTVEMRCQRPEDECLSSDDCASSGVSMYCDSDGKCQIQGTP